MLIPRKPEPSADILRSMFRYEPETGKLFWTINPPRQKGFIGKEAGTISVVRDIIRRAVQIQGKIYKVHRIIWKMQTGEDPGECIDHVNGDPLDNRWVNLRLATCSQNRANSRLAKNNRYGLKGVRFHPERKCWEAWINIQGKTRWLGKFETPDLAHAAYNDAAQQTFGAFARAA
jgi:hypothetical protein